MIAQLKQTVENTHATLLADALGVASLVILLVAALHLPSVI